MIVLVAAICYVAGFALGLVVRDSFGKGSTCTGDDACRVPEHQTEAGPHRTGSQVLCVRCGSTGPDGWCSWCDAPVEKNPR